MWKGAIYENNKKNVQFYAGIELKSYIIYLGWLQN